METGQSRRRARPGRIGQGHGGQRPGRVPHQRLATGRGQPHRVAAEAAHTDWTDHAIISAWARFSSGRLACSGAR